MFPDPPIRDWKRIGIVATIIMLILLANNHYFPKVLAQSADLTEWTLPDSNSGPWSVSVDSNGKVWFTENVTSRIAMFDPINNVLSEWSIPTGGSDPRYLFLKRAGDSLRIYFTEYSGNKIGYLDQSSNTFVEWSLPTANSKPVGIYVDDSLNVWFTESGRNVVGRITDSNVLTEYTLPGRGQVIGQPISTDAVTPWGLVYNTTFTGGVTNNYVWFTELSNNRVGRFEGGTQSLVFFPIN